MGSPGMMGRPTYQFPITGAARLIMARMRILLAEDERYRSLATGLKLE